MQKKTTTPVSLALTCKQHLSPRCGSPWRHWPCELVKSIQGHETAPLSDTEPCAALSVSLCSLLPRETGLSVLGSWSTLGHRTCLRHPTCPRYYTCPEPPHLPKAPHLQRHCTCLRCRPVVRPLAMLSSHTHTTALVPEVTMVVGDGHTAHRQRPQAAKFSNVIRICGRLDEWDEHWCQSRHRAGSWDRATEGCRQGWMVPLACLPACCGSRGT